MNDVDRRDVWAQLTRISLITLPALLVFMVFDQAPYLFDTFNRGQVFGRDAHNLWIAGRILLEERSALAIYDNDRFTAFQTAMVGSGVGWNSYFYPPTAFATAALVGSMPYPIALATYSAAGLLALMLAVGAPDFKRPVLLLLLVAPMTGFNLIMGQNGLISAALLVGGLRLLAHRPGMAGVLFGLLAFKPILGLLIPPLLLLRGQWRAFAYATLTVIATALLPILLWGSEVWTAFFTAALPLQQSVLHHAVGIGMLMIPSAFNSARIAGLDTVGSYLVHALFAVAALTIFLRHFVRRRHLRSLPLSTTDILVFTLATALMSPYVHNYDFSMIEAAILLWCVSLRRHPATPALTFVIATGWCVGLLSLFSNALHVPIAPLCLIAALYLVAGTNTDAEAGDAARSRPQAPT
tara:strand:+ start:1186 stop:2415 length:1230 start_codon:yes stop_codon:yes gene_type:complete